MEMTISNSVSSLYFQISEITTILCEAKEEKRFKRPKQTTFHEEIKVCWSKHQMRNNEVPAMEIEFDLIPHMTLQHLRGQQWIL